MTLWAESEVRPRPTTLKTSTSIKLASEKFSVERAAAAPRPWEIDDSQSASGGAGGSGFAKRRRVTGVGDDAIDRIKADWRRERPDVDVSSVGIVSRIWRLARHFEQARKRRLTEHGTDRVTLDVLAMLRRSGSPFRLTAGELTRHSLISSGGVSQRLDKLEKAGLVLRQFHPDDRRRVDVQLTDRGVELVDSTLADVMAHEAELLDGLTERERADLQRILKKLLSRFEPLGEAQGDVLSGDF